MPIGQSIRRRFTTKHRRSISGESVKTDESSSSDCTSTDSFPTLPSMGSSRHLSYIPHSRAHPQSSMPLPIAMLPERSNSPPFPRRSLTLPRGGSSAGSGAPPRPPRFTRPRAAPLPPTVQPATASVTSLPMASTPSSSSVETHAPPARAPNASPPPPIPRRAMPPWRAGLINLAESYAPLDTGAALTGYSHTHLMTRLHDPNLSERQALLVLRSYVDEVHASCTSHRGSPPRSGPPSDASDDDSDFGLAI